MDATWNLLRAAADSTLQVTAGRVGITTVTNDMLCCSTLLRLLS